MGNFLPFRVCRTNTCMRRERMVRPQPYLPTVKCLGTSIFSRPSANPVQTKPHNSSPPFNTPSSPILVGNSSSAPTPELCFRTLIHLDPLSFIQGIPWAIMAETSIFKRKRDVVYFVYFCVHLVVMLGTYIIPVFGVSFLKKRWEVWGWSRLGRRENIVFVVCVNVCFLRLFLFRVVFTHWFSLDRGISSPSTDTRIEAFLLSLSFPLSLFQFRHYILRNLYSQYTNPQ